MASGYGRDSSGRSTNIPEGVFHGWGVVEHCNACGHGIIQTGTGQEFIYMGTIEVEVPDELAAGVGARGFVFDYGTFSDSDDDEDPVVEDPVAAFWIDLAEHDDHTIKVKWCSVCDGGPMPEDHVDEDGNVIQYEINPIECAIMHPDNPDDFAMTPVTPVVPDDDDEFAAGIGTLGPSIVRRRPRKKRPLPAGIFFGPPTVTIKWCTRCRGADPPEEHLRDDGYLVVYEKDPTECPCRTKIAYGNRGFDGTTNE